MSDRFPRLAPAGGTPREVATAINRLAVGRSQAYGQLTLAANAATTVVVAPGLSPDSTVVLTPTSANAAAEIGNGTLYVTSKGLGSFTVAHANNAQTDRTFDFGWIG